MYLTNETINEVAADVLIPTHPLFPAFRAYCADQCKVPNRRNAKKFMHWQNKKHLKQAGERKPVAVPPSRNGASLVPVPGFCFRHPVKQKSVGLPAADLTPEVLAELRDCYDGPAKAVSLSTTRLG